MAQAQTSHSHRLNGDHRPTLCMYCHRTKLSDQHWHKSDRVSPLDEASHSICPDCYQIAMPRIIDEIRREIANFVS